MLRISLVSAALAVTLAGAGAVAAATTVEQERSALADAGRDAAKADPRIVASTLAVILADPAFAGLSPAEQNTAWRLAAEAQLKLKDPKAALVVLKLGGGPGADADYWRARITAAIRARDEDEAVASLQAMARAWPLALSRLPDATVTGLVGVAGKLDRSDARRIALLDALEAADWRPADATEDFGAGWLILTQALIERGDTARAARVAAKIRDPGLVIEMRADRRFDDLFDHAAASFDPVRLNAARIATARVAVAVDPRRIAPLLVLATELMRAGRAAEAQQILDAAHQVGQTRQGAFTDAATRGDWLMNARARASEHLGRLAEAEAILREAAATYDAGHVNIGQNINLAGLLDDLGRPVEALVATDGITPAMTSRFGWAAAVEVRGRAYAGLGDRPGVDRSLAALRGEVAANPEALLKLLIAANDLDAAAKALIDQLADSHMRLHALGVLQVYAAEPAAETPVSRENQRRFDLVRARADVQAAVAKVGRIEHYDLIDP